MLIYTNKRIEYCLYLFYHKRKKYYKRERNIEKNPSFSEKASLAGEKDSDIKITIENCFLVI